jgi:UDP-glucose 4-epimerase
MIVVIGAGGFIGSYLVDALVAGGFKVLAVDKSKLAEGHYSQRSVPFLRADITDEESFKKLPASGVEAVVNVACLQPHNVSEQAYKPSEYIRINVIGTLNALAYCRQNGIGKIVYTISHRGVQGLWDRGEIIDESATKALKHTGDYAMFSISEIAAMDCVEYYTHQHGLRGVVLRLPPVYGYGPHLEGFRDGKPVKTGFLAFIEQAKAGKPLELWGDYERARDIVYVKDVVSAIILAIRNKDAVGLYNIASGEKVSLKQEAEEIVRLFSPKGKPSSFTYAPDRPNSVEPFHYDIRKARQDLQWFPRYLVKEMLEDIKKEMESERFGFLLEKRRKMLAGERDDGNE